MAEPRVREKGPKGLFRAFGFAGSGFVQAVRTERNMKIHLGFAALALLLCLLLRCTLVEWLIVIVMIGAVLAAELFNTAIESAVDLACPEESPKAKTAKDAAAGAVLVLAIAALVVGLAIYIHALVRIFA
ncbi:MAG: diacylglycerol kinase family protein [bacterium]|nr:diacylglycerol kinase family protein [bacterium]